MKKQKLNRLVLTMLMALVSMWANAYHVEVDGIYYDLNTNEKTACVTTGDNSYSGDVVIPASIAHNGETYSVTGIGNRAFFRAPITSIEIPEGVTSIGVLAFYESPLTSFVMPASITHLDREAFNGCRNLVTMTMSGNIEEIGKSAFACCSGLQEIKIVGGDNFYMKNDCLISKDGRLILALNKPSIVIPYGVKIIGDYVFSFHNLINVSIPNSVTSIEDGAFDGVGSLASITIPASVTEIGNQNPWAGNNLKEIIVAGGDNFFVENNCLISKDGRVITGFNINEDNTSIIIPNSAKTIGIGAFGSQGHIESITIPSTVTSIGARAFNCSGSLHNLDIGESLESIGDYAFYYGLADDFVTITLRAAVPPTLRNWVFVWRPLERYTLRVPADAIDVYRNADGWKEFGNIIPICDDFLAIDDMCAKAGRTVDVPVVLKNKSVINSIGGKISLPEGMEIEKNAKGKCIFKLNEDRASAEDAFSVSSSVQADGSVKFLLVSTDGTDISGHDGAVMYVPVVVGDDLEGDYTIKLTSVQMSDDAARLIDCPDVEATMTVEQYTLGDVNNDGQIAPNDITMTIKAYLGDMPAGFVRKAADINENGVIDPADVTAIIKLYLDGGASNAPMRKAVRAAAANEVDSDDGVYLSAVTVEPDSECEIELSMDLKRSDYTNLGGIITLPEGFTFALNAKGKPVVKKNSDVLEYHTVSTNLLNDRQMKFFIGSNDLDLIDAGLSTLIGVKIKASATVEAGDFTYTLTALQLSDYDANLYNAADAEGTITVKGAEATGIAAAGAEDSDAKAYNLNGQRVDAKGARGIVIIDGKKMMRK